MNSAFQLPDKTTAWKIANDSWGDQLSEGESIRITLGPDPDADKEDLLGVVDLHGKSYGAYRA